jgi:hypothetical protein
VTRQVLVVSILLSSSLLSAAPAFAFGAIADGIPDDVGKDGFTQGYSYGARTQEDAEASALKYCRQTKQTVAAARCTVVRTFNGQCVSLAKEDDTPGYGYGVGDDKASAEREAMVMCYETTPADHAQSCRITASECDQ